MNDNVWSGGSHFMKTAESLAAVLIITLALAIPGRAQSFLTNGLVAYYPFNGNANDASGNGDNLTVNGATPCADRFGNTNQAYSFNGSSSIDSSTPPLSQVDNWTISAWIQSALFSPGLTYAVFMGYDNGTGGNGYGFGLDGGNQLYGLFGGIGPFFGGYVLPSTNQWYQVVMLRSSGSTTIFVNGALTTNNVTTTPEIPTSFEIGSANGTRFFDGAIDDVRIYDRPLSSIEVEQLYQYESAPPCALPYPATATATVANGFLVGATVTDGGCGYTNTPLVQIAGGGGTGATATAVITNGVVIGITITDAGIGYTSTPTIYINSPLGVQIGILQAVIPIFSSLSIGSNYQLQASADLSTWTNEGPAFAATNSTMIYPQYFNVISWTQLYFRLQAAP
jgi:hypothetical protein